MTVQGGHFCEHYVVVNALHNGTRIGTTFNTKNTEPETYSGISTLKTTTAVM